MPRGTKHLVVANRIQLIFLSSFSITPPSGSRWIRSGRRFLLTVTFNASYEGRYEDTLELHFHEMQHNQRFSITRQLRATVGSVIDQENLKPKAPYSRRKSAALPLDGRIISPLRPPTWTETKWTITLPQFKVPKDLNQAINSSAQNFVPSSLSEKTYGRRFQVLLWIEEEQRRSDPPCIYITEFS